MQNSAIEKISHFVMSEYYLSDRSFFNTPGVSRAEIKDEIFSLKAKRSDLNFDLPNDWIDLMSRWNGMNISFSLKTGSVSFSDVKFKLEIFGFGKAGKSIRNFHEVNSKSPFSEYLLIGFSNCYHETENGNAFGSGYIAIDKAGDYWHVDNGADDFHAPHLLGKSIAEVCDYLFPKTL